MDKVKNQKHKYIFPNFLSNFMSKIDQRTQYEAGMLSMTFMLVGMVVTVFYVSLYLTIPTWYRVVLIINMIAGLVLMSSYLVTQYQQYTSYMNVKDYQNELKGGTTA